MISSKVFSQRSRQALLLTALIFSSGNVLSELSPTVNSLEFSVIKTAESSGSLEATVVEGGGWFTVRQLVHTAMLVRHPKGDFLWDSGIGSESESQMEVLNLLEKQLFSIENIVPAQVQLTAEGYAIKDLMAIIPSHMHWDHVSGLEDFTGVPVWVQKKSYDEAMAGKAPAFIASQYDSPELNWQPLELNKTPYQGFASSFDIYGDGTAVLVDLSGHSDGQLGLFLTPNSGRQFFFIGDTTWAVEGIEENKSRPWITDAIAGVDSDFEKNADVIEQIHLLSKQNPELFIVPAHDELQLKQLPNFPTFIK
jgi:N-acyl homoserine lactone hydrolase